jgi:sugar-specific transcriptional regulator TrmB
MNQEHLLKKLQKAGLSKNEAQIYLLLFKIGSQPASIVGKRLEIPRSTAGFHLEELHKKGLLSKSKRGNMFLYSISSSDALLLFLNSQKNAEISRFNEQIRTAQDILPELQSFRGKSPTRPKIAFYEGVDGLKKVYEDTLTSSETLRSFAYADSMHEGLPDYFPDYYTRRSQKNLHIRSVHPDSEETRELIKRNKQELRDGLIIPVKKFSFTPEVQFYDGKVNIASWKEKLGIIIESKEIYDVFVVMFELAFAEAKRYDSKLRK